MESGRSESETRRVLLGTVHGMIEGSIGVGPQIRTLDFFNRASTRFVSLRAARAVGATPSLQGESASVNLASILWVTEVQAMSAGGPSRAKPLLNRCAVRFCFANCEVVGFLHTPPQGDPFARLNQDRGVFIALTSVSIIGPDTELSAEFMAVNSNHLFTAELIEQDDTELEGTSAFEEAGS